MRSNTSLLLAGVCACGLLLTAQAQTRILPLGDSVTSSFAPYASYRYWLWHELVDAGYDVDFVGSQQGVANGAPARQDYDQDHEGHPGWATQDALYYVDDIAALTHPDVVLLDLGANDVEQGVPLDMITANFESLIEHFREVNPNVIVLLAEPTPYRGPNSGRLSKLKSLIKRVANAENRDDSPVLSVRVGGFNARKHTFDGVHPNEAGEVKIAHRLFLTLTKVLP